MITWGAAMVIAGLTPTIALLGREIPKPLDRVLTGLMVGGLLLWTTGFGRMLVC